MAILRPGPFPMLLGCHFALFAATAVGQVLSITRQGQNAYRIEGTAPSEIRYVLQGSWDLQEWVDLQDEVWGELSYQFDRPGVTRCFFRLTPWKPLLPPITVVLIGDSTVMDGCGWGQGIPGYFAPSVFVVNLAWPALSSSGFLASEQMPKMLAIKPDFVLVQFGMVIEPVGCEDPARCPMSLAVLADNLKAIVRSIRGFHGTPVLITPPVRRLFDDQGKVQPVLDDPCVAVREVAAESQVHLVDLNQLTRALYDELGDAASDFITVSDRLHFTPAGAIVIAGLVVEALPESLRPYVIPHPDEPQEP